MQSCLQKRPQDTSAAWKAEAEKAQADAKKHKKENKLLLEELSIIKNALAQQSSEGEASPTLETKAVRTKNKISLAKRYIAPIEVMWQFLEELHHLTFVTSAAGKE